MIEFEPREDPKGQPFLSRGIAGRIVDLYRAEREVWLSHYRRFFKCSARALGLGFVAGFLYFTLWPTQEQKALAFVVKSLEDIAIDGKPLHMALDLFYHNARASFMAITAGVFPFLCLPILDPVINGGVLGLLVSVSKHQGLNVPVLMLTQILPHGVFELPAVLYATSVGIYLSKGLGRKALAAWRRRGGRERDQRSPAEDLVSFLGAYPARSKAEDESLFGNTVRSFVLVVLPLLAVAALIEAFITPLLG
jgi:stage II sporulation protein M